MAKIYYVCYIVVVAVVGVFTFVTKTRYLSRLFGLPFAVLIHLVVLIYCEICDGLKQDTDITSLILNYILHFWNALDYFVRINICHFKDGIMLFLYCGILRVAYGI